MVDSEKKIFWVLASERGWKEVSIEVYPPPPNILQKSLVRRPENEFFVDSNLYISTIWKQVIITDD